MYVPIEFAVHHQEHNRRLSLTQSTSFTKNLTTVCDHTWIELFILQRLSIMAKESQIELEFQWAWICMNSILLMTTIYPFIKLCRSYSSINGFLGRLVYYPGLMVVASSIFLLCILIIVGLCMIYDNQLHELLYITATISGIAYAFQKYSLCISLFVRCYFIFKTTAMAISKCTVRIYIIMFILAFGLMIFLPFIYHLRGRLYWTIIVGSFVILIIGLMVSLIILFLYKLCQAHSIDYKGDDSLTQLVNKTTVLGMISIFSNALAPLSIILRFQSVNHIAWIHFISNILISFEIYSNFSCVVLSYKNYDKTYHKLCGCFDKLCQGNNNGNEHNGEITITKRDTSRTKTVLSCHIGAYNATPRTTFVVGNNGMNMMPASDPTQLALPSQSTVLTTNSSDTVISVASFDRRSSLPSMHLAMSQFSASIGENDCLSDNENNNNKDNEHKDESNILNMNEFIQKTITAPPSRRPTLHTIAGSIDTVQDDEAEIVYNDDCINPKAIINNNDLPTLDIQYDLRSEMKHCNLMKHDLLKMEQRESRRSVSIDNMDCQINSDMMQSENMDNQTTENRDSAKSSKRVNIVDQLRTELHSSMASFHRSQQIENMLVSADIEMGMEADPKINTESDEHESESEIEIVYDHENEISK